MEPPPCSESHPDESSDPYFVAPRYLAVASMTLCVWDWLLHVADEYQMVKKSKRPLSRIANGVYFIARISPLAYVASNVLVITGLVSDCGPVTRFEAIIDIIAVPAISLLFLFRVTAIYLHSRVAIAIFVTCWLALLGSFVYNSLTLLSGSIHTSKTRPCNLVGRTTDAWAYIANGIFDTLVYLAISWRLASTSMIGNSFWDRLRSFIRGDGLLGLSKVLLKSGQFYYFMTIWINISTALTTFVPGVHDEWWGLLTFPSIAIQSVMACRLFRELRLRAIVDPLMDKTDIVTSMVFASAAAHVTCTDIELGEDLHQSHDSDIAPEETVENDGWIRPRCEHPLEE